MKQYLSLLKHIVDSGTVKDDRTGVGTISVFGYQNRYDLNDGFPLLTTKKLHLKSIIYELLWFIMGDTNIRYLNQNGVRIWNEWADENGELGPIYGAQWRRWIASDGKEVDQLENIISEIQDNSNSRRLIISSWNAGEINKMALSPCHCLIQFYVVGGKLSCQLYQRSADVFLGVPFNIASYALFTMMIAQVCELKPGEFIHTFGDVHLYKNHIKQTKTQLQRTPRQLPTIELNPKIKKIGDFGYEDIKLLGYKPLPHIKADVAV